MVQEEEWNLWKQDPATQALFSHLQKVIEELKTDWSDSGMIDPESALTTYGKNVSATAKIYLSREIIALDYKELTGADDD